MSIWSQKRVTAFLHIWNLLMPLKIILSTSSLNLSFIIYAGVWGYLPNNPFTDSPLIISVFYALFMFPFYIPGIIIASFVWNSFKNPNLTRYRYIETILVLQIVYILVIWILIPCPISTHPPLCIPVPSSGLVALLFVSKVVKDIKVPWPENDTVHVSVPVFDDMIRVPFRTRIASMLRGGKSSQESKQVHEEVEEQEHIDEL